MYLRAKTRFKDGKKHRYWSIVESCRNHDGRVVQRQVLYLGEINDSQKAAWCKTIEVLQEDSRASQVALFPTDREAPALDCDVVHIKLNELQLHHPRQWGACWLVLTLWDQLHLDDFWQTRLPVSRQGTKWLEVLKIQVCYQLIDPGSEWRLHRHWYEHSALRDLLGSPVRVISDDTLYRCLDKLLAHKRAFFSFLRERWESLFQVRFDVLLYDLTYIPHFSETISRHFMCVRVFVVRLFDRPMAGRPADPGPGAGAQSVPGRTRGRSGRRTATGGVARG